MTANDLYYLHKRERWIGYRFRDWSMHYWRFIHIEDTISSNKGPFFCFTIPIYIQFKDATYTKKLKYISEQAEDTCLLYFL